MAVSEPAKRNEKSRQTEIAKTILRGSSVPPVEAPSKSTLQRREIAE